jgi:ribosomal protein S12 methylthiotransferase accessory factor
MRIRFKRIEQLLNTFERNRLLKSIGQINLFYDEPPIYYFQAALNESAKYLKKYTYSIPENSIAVGGISFLSREFALFKCFSEAVERMALFMCKKKYTHTSYERIKDQAVDPYIYKSLPAIRQEEFGWIKGKNITTGTTSFIPAQLVYLSYPQYATYELDKSERLLTYPISTGSAAGANEHDVMLRGLYEVIERDACMTAYLTKVPLPKVDVDSLKGAQIERILKQCERYNIEVHCFDATNDLHVPVFICILIDKTGIGPAVTVGSKAGHDTEYAIVGSIEEAFMARIGLRYEFLKEKHGSLMKPGDLITQRERMLYWSFPHMTKHISHLITQTPRKITQHKAGIHDLKNTVHTLNQLGYSVYFINMSEPLFLKQGIRCGKIIVPGLQPLYLNENRQEVKKDRLYKVARHFKIGNYKINKIPHPFL